MIKNIISNAIQNVSDIFYIRNSNVIESITEEHIDELTGKMESVAQSMDYDLITAPYQVQTTIAMVSLINVIDGTDNERYTVLLRRLINHCDDKLHQMKGRKRPFIQEDSEVFRLLYMNKLHLLTLIEHRMIRLFEQSNLPNENIDLDKAIDGLGLSEPTIANLVDYRGYYPQDWLSKLNEYHQLMMS